MKSITFRLGPLRISVGRLFSGGLCPLNVMGRNWSIIPRFLEQQKDSEQGGLDLSPTGAGNLFLSALRRLLERQRKS